jgi:hypothetical protein
LRRFYGFILRFPFAIQTKKPFSFWEEGFFVVLCFQLLLPKTYPSADVPPVVVVVVDVVIVFSIIVWCCIVSGGKVSSNILNVQG